MDLSIFITFLSLGLIVALCLAAIYWFVGIVLPILQGSAPFVPTPHKHTREMIQLAAITESDVVADLGSGDGRLVIAAAKAGAKESIGYEINAGLVTYSQHQIKKYKLDNARIEKESFWKIPFHEVNVLLIYQSPTSMARLENKCITELPAGARVVSKGFTFPNWELVQQVGHIYLYKI